MRTKAITKFQLSILFMGIRLSYICFAEECLWLSFFGNKSCLHVFVLLKSRSNFLITAKFNMPRVQNRTTKNRKGTCSGSMYSGIFHFLVYVLVVIIPLLLVAAYIFLSSTFRANRVEAIIVRLHKY